MQRGARIGERVMHTLSPKSQQGGVHVFVYCSKEHLEESRGFQAQDRVCFMETIVVLKALRSVNKDTKLSADEKELLSKKLITYL